MIKGFDKIIKIIDLLNDYFILLEDKEKGYAILITNIVKEWQKPVAQKDSFTPYNHQNNGHHKFISFLPVTFLITMDSKKSPYEKFCLENKVPILHIDKTEVDKLLLEGNTLKRLDDFVAANFES